MMSERRRNPNGWDYRVVHAIEVEYGTNIVTHEYGVHEVYYENDRPIGMTMNPVPPHGDTHLELELVWQSYKKAFEKHVLVFNDSLNMFVEDTEPPIDPPRTARKKKNEK